MASISMKLGNFIVSYSETHFTIAFHNLDGGYVVVDDEILNGIKSIGDMYRVLNILYPKASKAKVERYFRTIVEHFNPQWHLSFL